MKGKQQDLTNFPLERSRIDVIAPAHVMGTIAFVIFGWLIDKRVHIAGPLVVSAFIGFSVSASFNTSNTLLLDLHRSKPATATAAVNFVRCLISAGGVAAIVPMVKGMGPGWCMTAWGFAFIAVMPLLWVLVRHGPSMRAQQAEKEARKEREKEIVAAASTQSDSEALSLNVSTAQDEKQKEVV